MFSRRGLQLELRLGSNRPSGRAVRVFVPRSNLSFTCMDPSARPQLVETSAESSCRGPTVKLPQTSRKCTPFSPSPDTLPSRHLVDRGRAAPWFPLRHLRPSISRLVAAPPPPFDSPSPPLPPNQNLTMSVRAAFGKTRPLMARYDVSPHLVKLWKTHKHTDGQVRSRGRTSRAANGQSSRAEPRRACCFTP